MSYLTAASHVLPLLLVIFFGLLVVTTVAGLGVTELLLPSGGFSFLLAPAVGLGIIALALAWLGHLFPPVVAVIVAVAIGGVLTAIAMRRRRGLLTSAGRDALGALGFGLAFYIALLQMVIARGFLTLGGFPSDNVFIYVQAAQYLRDHAAPTTFSPAALINPGSLYLDVVGPAFPSPVGGVDAAANVISGLPVYALFDPINAFALALTVGPVWFFVRRLLGCSGWVAMAAVAMLAVSQLMYWVEGLGFQQEIIALPIFTSGLTALIVAVRAGSARGGALVGLLGAAAIGVYLPIAVLLAFCCVVVLLVAAAGEPWTGRRLLAITGAATGAGLAASLASLALLFMAGLRVWTSAVGVRTPAGAISSFPALPYVFGALPFAHSWGVNPQAYGRIERYTLPLLILASVLMVVLLVAGQVRAAVGGRVLEASALTAGFIFVGYEAAVADYPYAFVKSLSYMLPLSAAFIAYGATGLGTLVPRLPQKPAMWAGWASLAIVLASSAVASRDMIHLFTNRDASFTSAELNLDKIAGSIPPGANVLINVPDSQYDDLVKIAAVAYFLPDRAVRVYSGTVRIGTYYLQDVPAAACAFDYVVAADRPDGNFTLVYSNPQEELNVYKRDGPACPRS